METENEDRPAAGEQVGRMWEGAKTSATSKLNEQKDAAAEGMGNIAEALRGAANQRSDEGGADRSVLDGLTGSAADGLDRLSGSLRNKDVATMVRDVEDFAREQPLAFFGLAVAAGFAGVRFIKASNT